MSEVIERVARALCRSKRNRPQGYPDGWMERHVNENWHLFEDDAKTSIAAMREPTDAMIEAACAVSMDIGTPQQLYHGWQAAIDEALK